MQTSAQQTELNRIATYAWCGVATIESAQQWETEASIEHGELHSGMWEVFSINDSAQLESLLRQLAREINHFAVDSLDAEPFAQEALLIASKKLLQTTMTVPEYCQLVNQLDCAFNVAIDERPEPSGKRAEPDKWWMGDLYNHCDWCDDTWNHSNSRELLAETERLYQDGKP